MRLISTFKSAVLLLALGLLCPATASWAEPITLFNNGDFSLEWLLSDHEGAKKFRGGKSCLSCHEDDEAEMGKNIVKASKSTVDKTRPSIPAELQFSQQGEQTQIVFRFSSPPSAFDFSLMFDDGGVGAFTRAGCWASCHDDMQGMPADTDLDKYLGKSRKKMSRTGGGKAMKPDSELAKMKSEGLFVELWEIQVDATGNTKVQLYSLLQERQAIKPLNLTAKAKHENGQWTLTLSRKSEIKGQKPMNKTAQVFGIALHQNNDGVHHWVSLPKQFGSSEDADYKVKPL